MLVHLSGAPRATRSPAPPVALAVVGDYDAAFPPHRATDAAVAHAAAALGVAVDLRWVPTPEVAAAPATLGALLGHAVWIAPGSPYRSMDGALRAIRHARETGLPLLGTCGGFQHVVLEYARHVLGVADAQHAEYVAAGSAPGGTDPYASALFVTPLSCSLVGRAMPVRLEPASRAAAWYGATDAVEQYYCNFGLNPAYEATLEAGGLRIVGRDADGEARVLELPTHPYFVATLFVPSLTSTPERPHPLVLQLLASARPATDAGLPPGSRATSPRGRNDTA